MIGQLGVGGPHDLVDVRAGLDDEDGVHAFGRRSARRCADDGGVPHARLRGQRALDVLRKDVQPLGGDDHLLLAAADVELSLVVELARRRLCGTSRP